jgi:hypothetical protein
MSRFKTARSENAWPPKAPAAPYPNPTVMVLAKLAKALGVEADELLRTPAKTKGK